jgi:hypothetical protein
VRLDEHWRSVEREARAIDAGAAAGFSQITIVDAPGRHARLLGRARRAGAARASRRARANGDASGTNGRIEALAVERELEARLRAADGQRSAERRGAGGGVGRRRQRVACRRAPPRPPPSARRQPSGESQLGSSAQVGDLGLTRQAVPARCERRRRAGNGERLIAASACWSAMCACPML